MSRAKPVCFHVLAGWLDEGHSKIAQARGAHSPALGEVGARCGIIRKHWRSASSAVLFRHRRVALDRKISAPL